MTLKELEAAQHESAKKIADLSSVVAGIQSEMTGIHTELSEIRSAMKEIQSEMKAAREERNTATEERARFFSLLEKMELKLLEPVQSVAVNPVPSIPEASKSSIPLVEKNADDIYEIGGFTIPPVVSPIVNSVYEEIVIGNYLLVLSTTIDNPGVVTGKNDIDDSSSFGAKSCLMDCCVCVDGFTWIPTIHQCLKDICSDIGTIRFCLYIVMFIENRKEFIMCFDPGILYNTLRIERSLLCFSPNNAYSNSTSFFLYGSTIFVLWKEMVTYAETASREWSMVCIWFYDLGIGCSTKIVRPSYSVLYLLELQYYECYVLLRTLEVATCYSDEYSSVLPEIAATIPSDKEPKHGRILTDYVLQQEACVTAFYSCVAYDGFELVVKLTIYSVYPTYLDRICGIIVQGIIWVVLIRVQGFTKWKYSSPKVVAVSEFQADIKGLHALNQDHIQADVVLVSGTSGITMVHYVEHSLEKETVCFLHFSSQLKYSYNHQGQLTEVGLDAVVLFNAFDNLSDFVMVGKVLTMHNDVFQEELIVCQFLRLNRKMDVMRFFNIPAASISSGLDLLHNRALFALFSDKPIAGNTVGSDVTEIFLHMIFYISTGLPHVKMKSPIEGNTRPRLHGRQNFGFQIGFQDYIAKTQVCRKLWATCTVINWVILRTAAAGGGEWTHLLGIAVTDQVLFWGVSQGVNGTVPCNQWASKGKRITNSVVCHKAVLVIDRVVADSISHDGYPLNSVDIVQSMGGDIMVLTVYSDWLQDVQEIIPTLKLNTFDTSPRFAINEDVTTGLYFFG